MDETEAFPDPLIPGGKARIRQIPSAVPFCRADTGRVWRDFLKKKPLPLKTASFKGPIFRMFRFHGGQKPFLAAQRPAAFPP